MVDLRVLRSFLKIAQAGSISRASEELRVTQPALSKMIRNLEVDLGARLFNRTGRGVVLTEAGARFRREVETAIGLLDAAVADIRNENHRTSGEVRIGILPNMVAGFASDLLTEVNRRYPEIRLVLLEGYSGTLARHLVNRELDFGFVHGPDRFNGLDVEFCLREDAFLIGRKSGWPFGREVEVRELATLPIVTSPRARPGGTSLSRRLIDDACLTAHVEPNIAAEMESWEVQKSMVAMGKGTAIFPMSCVWAELASGTFAASRLVDPPITFDLALVSASWASAPRCAPTVVGVIRDLVESCLASGRWVGTFSILS